MPDNYPNIINSSNAPDFAAALLRIPGQYNEMANANARTEIARKEQATREWMAKISADKAAQELLFAPAEEARKAALAENTIRATSADINSRSYTDMLNDIHGQLAQKSFQDQLSNEQAIKDMNTELTKLQPWEYASEKGLDVMNRYSDKFTDPTIAAKVYHGFADQRQDYRNAQERTQFDPEDLAIYKDARDVQKLDDGQAMALAKEAAANRRAAQEAQRQILIEQAKQEAKPDSLTAAEQDQIRFLVGSVPRNKSEGDPTPEQRARATALATNIVVEARRNRGQIDAEKVKHIWEEAMKGGDYKSQLDKTFDVLK